VFVDVMLENVSIISSLQFAGAARCR